MKLLPSLKQKKRYIVFESNIPEKELKPAIKDALKDFLGIYGLSKASPEFVKSKNSRFILKVNHKYVPHAKSALLLITKVKNKSVILKSIITSGTIKKASSYLE